MAEGTLGNLKIGLLWDVKGFADGAKSLVNIAQMTGKNIDAALKLKPLVFPLSGFDAEVKKLDASLKQVQTNVTGTQNSLKQVSAATDTAKNSFNNLDASVKKTTESKSLFRQKSVNLGADLTVLSFGVRKVIDDFKELGKQLRSGNADAGQVAATFGTMTLSLLSMMPALNAIKSALPATFLAGSSAVGLFGAALFDAVNKADTLYKSFINLTQGGQGFFESIANALSNNMIGNLTKQILGLNDAVDQSLGYLLASEDERYKMKKLEENRKLGIPDEITQYGFQLDAEQKRADEDKKQREETFRRNIANYEKQSVNHSSSKSNSVKEEIKQLNTYDSIMKQIADIENKLAIETLPLQKKEFENQILLLKERIKYLNGDYEKIDLSGFSSKLLPEEKILSRSERGDKSKGGMNFITESIANLKAQLVGLAAMEGIITGISNSFGSLFAAFVPPQGADSPLKSFLKSVVTSIITAVQASILAAQGFAAAQSVFTFGISLLKDAPLIAAALVALEAAKGFISGFRVGGYTGDGDENAPAGTVHKGEFVIRKSAVRKIVDNLGMGFLQMLNGGNTAPMFAGSYNTGGIVSALTGKPAGDSFKIDAYGLTEESSFKIYRNGKLMNAQLNKATRINND